MFRPQKAEKYPKEMTFAQAGTFKIYHSFYEEEDAKAFAKKIDGQLYTQISTGVPDRRGEGDRYYIGDSTDNRGCWTTGFFIVVKHLRTFSDRAYLPVMEGCVCSGCS